jgi:hypothetical protein
MKKAFSYLRPDTRSRRPHPCNDNDTFVEFLSERYFSPHSPSLPPFLASLPCLPSLPSLRLTPLTQASNRCVVIERPTLGRRRGGGITRVAIWAYLRGGLIGSPRAISRSVSSRVLSHYRGSLAPTLPSPRPSRGPSCEMEKELPMRCRRN